jgi:hypothetical protein
MHHSSRFSGPRNATPRLQPRKSQSQAAYNRGLANQRA